jgi:hypothetical protein
MKIGEAHRTQSPYLYKRTDVPLRQQAMLTKLSKPIMFHGFCFGLVRHYYWRRGYW